MKRSWRIGIAILLLLACCVSAVAENTVDECIDGILHVMGGQSHETWAKNDLPKLVGATGEWYALTLRQYEPTLSLSAYADALASYVEQNAVSSASTREKLALALLVCGRSEHPFIQATVSDSIGKQGIISWVFGLHLLDNGAVGGEYTEEQIIREILNRQNTDGGWIVAGKYSDVDTTAMVLQALAKHADDFAVQTAIDSALAYISEKQGEAGDYAAYGKYNAESCAQVILALTALGIDPKTDGRFCKNGNSVWDGFMRYRLSDGSFCHVLGEGMSESATVQACMALVSMQKGAFYDFTDLPTMRNAARTMGWKAWTYIGIGSACLLICLIIFLTKRKWKNIVFILLAGGVLALIVSFLDIQSAETYYSGQTVAKDSIGSVVMTIRCDVLGKTDASYIPSDGIILPETEFPIAEGDTVYTILTEAARQYHIQMESSGASVGSGELAYISGMNYIYEFDFGDLSGWKYSVNGEFPSVGCGKYVLSAGDSIVWQYSLELGNDLSE